MYPHGRHLVAECEVIYDRLKGTSIVVKDIQNKMLPVLDAYGLVGKVDELTSTTLPDLAVLQMICNNYMDLCAALSGILPKRVVMMHVEAILKHDVMSCLREGIHIVTRLYILWVDTLLDGTMGIAEWHEWCGEPLQLLGSFVSGFGEKQRTMLVCWLGERTLDQILYLQKSATLLLQAATLPSTSDPDAVKTFCVEVASITDAIVLEKHRRFLTEDFVDRLSEWFRTFFENDGKDCAERTREQMQVTAAAQILPMMQGLRAAFGDGVDILHFWDPLPSPDVFQRLKSWEISAKYAQELIQFASDTGDARFVQEVQFVLSANRLVSVAAMCAEAYSKFTDVDSRLLTKAQAEMVLSLQVELANFKVFGKQQENK